MFACRLCQLTVDEIPDDAIQCGKLYRFSTGEYHDLRKKMEPRKGPRPRKINPDRESPQEPITVPFTSPVMGTNARDVPDPSTKQKKEEEQEETRAGTYRNVNGTCF